MWLGKLDRFKACFGATRRHSEAYQSVPEIAMSYSSKILAVLALFVSGGNSYAGQVVVVGSIPSPLPAPRFGLAFDTTARTLWGINNPTESSDVMNFDLQGNLLSGFKTVPEFNNEGIAVNQESGAADAYSTGRTWARTCVRPCRMVHLSALLNYHFYII